MPDEESAQPAPERDPADSTAVESSGYPEPTPPTPTVRVVYHAPYGTDQPVEVAGRAWFDQAAYDLSPDEAALALAQPGFLEGDKL
jgi:hypothetical protein